MQTKILYALALALTAGCAADQLSGAESSLGLPPLGGSGSKFHWAAYEHEPYIYRGCPEPGPEPWAERATLHARAGTSRLELELGTEVPLEIRPLSMPRDMHMEPHSRGVTLTVDDPFVSDPAGFTMLVTAGRCSYELEAEIAFE